MTNEQMTTKENGPMAEAEKTSPVYRSTPAVDIYETDDSLVVTADMPGVEEKDLQIEIAREILTLEGGFSVGEGGRAGYYRQFKLSDRIDAEAGEAALKDGVLTLRLPKSEAAKPKRIAVKTLH